MWKKSKIVLVLFLLIPVLLLMGCELEKASSSSKEKHVVRIGYQKNGPLVILKSLGTLEQRLEAEGFQVEWREFQQGPALMEALHANSIDFGRTGNSPVIFAQAANTPFVIVAAGKPKYEGSGILVPRNSSINTVSDLKGKKVSFAKGSSSHYLIVKALEQAGLNYSDITPAFLSPGDARVAFEQGNVDAMVVWDPFTASTELNSNAKLLVNGEGITTDRDFFVTTESFYKQYKHIVEIIIEEIQYSSEWANTHHEELVSILAPILNIDEASIELTVKRRIYGVDPITDEIIQEQQEIANTFYELKIIPKKVNVLDVMKVD